VALVFVSTVIAAPAGAVWERIADFTTWHQWIPRIASTTMDPGNEAGQVGCVRIIGLTDGSSVRERLVSKDNARRVIAYDFPAGSPFPVRRYQGMVRVEDVTTSGEAYLHWSGDFDADEALESTVAEIFRKTYSSFLEALSVAMRG
jgi:hypothetical protein